ncbi:NUDIX hydrolase [Kribbella sp. NPDC026611]|uniref:NUDIX hydrolase n=1 Tax=Kribbella sp. NPDC026611 TaxID=3154911 RepID=UPI0033E7530C
MGSAGGVVERDESPRAGARREVLEELGVAVEPGALLAADWVGRQGEFTEVVAFLFDGGVIAGSGQLELQAEEIRSARFVSLDEAEGLLDSEAFARVGAAMRVRVVGATAYLENGLPVG